MKCDWGLHKQHLNSLTKHQPTSNIYLIDKVWTLQKSTVIIQANFGRKTTCFYYNNQFSISAQQPSHLCSPTIFRPQEMAAENLWVKLRRFPLCITKDIKSVPDADNNMTSDPFVMIFWMGEKKQHITSMRFSTISVIVKQVSYV